MGTMGTTFKVIVERNFTDTQMELVQDELFEILNEQSVWLLETAQTGARQFEFLSVRSQSKLVKLVAPSLVDDVLLLLGDLETFEEKIEDLLLNNRVYRGFRLVVVLLEVGAENFDEIARHLMQTAWERKLFSTVIITQTNITDEWYVYDTRFIWNMDKSKRCIENVAPRVCLICRNKTITLKTVRNYWYRKPKLPPCTVDVISFELPPFVVNETEGFEVKLIKILGEHINVNFELMIERNGDSFWGELNKSDGSWSGRLGQVEEKSAVAVGNLKAMTVLYRYFDFSEAYYYDKMVWVVPVAELAPRWMRIFMPFTRQLWLLMIVIIVVGGVFLRLSYVKKERCIYSVLERTLFVSLEAFLGVGTKRPPISRLARSFFGSLALCGIFFSSVYQGSLINVLTHPIYQHQINSLEEVIKSGLNIGGFAPYKQYFNVSNDEPSMKIYNMFETKRNANVYDWLGIVARERNVATLSSQLHVKYLIASGDRAVVENGFPKVYVLNEIVVPIATSMLMPRGFPLTHRINRGIQDMITNGIAMKLSQNAKTTLKKYESRKEVIFSGRQVVALTMDNLEGAFVLLLLGYCTAIVVFVLELVFHKFDLCNKLMKLYKRGVRRDLMKWMTGKRG